MTTTRVSGERGFTLVEMLVTVVIMGVAFAIFVGGMGVSVLTADYNNKHAAVRAAIRNFAEAIKAADYVTDCSAASAPYLASYSPPPPTRDSIAAALASTNAPAAPGLTPSKANSALLVFYAVGTNSTLVPPASAGAAVWNVASTNAVVTSRVTAMMANEAVPTTADTGQRVATATPAGVAVTQSVLLESPSGAANSIIRRSSVSTATGTGVTSLDLAKPSGVSIGDALMAQIAFRGGDDVTVTAPVGWSVVSAQAKDTAVRSVVYERTVTNTTASTFSWTLSAPVDVVGAVAAYSGTSTSVVASITAIKGWNGTTPIDDASFVACPTSDNGLQRVSIQVASSDGRSTETLDVIKRRP